MSTTNTIEFAASIINEYACKESEIINYIKSELEAACELLILTKLEDKLKIFPNYIVINYIPVVCNNDDCNHYKYITFEYVNSLSGHFDAFTIEGSKCRCQHVDAYKTKAELPEVYDTDNLREVDDR